MKTIKYKKGYKYQLYADYTDQLKIYPLAEIYTKYISLSVSGVIIIKAGYAWDGPSGPTIDTLNAMRGSLTHDAVYQLFRQGELDVKWRKEADIHFYDDLRIDKMFWIRAKYWFYAVRKKAANAASRKNAKKVITAPF